MKLIKYILIVIFCFSFHFVKGQETGFYYKYVFEDFLLVKTTDREVYKNTLKENIKYPPIARENGFEGQLNFMIIDNGNDNLELILVDSDIKSQNDKIKNYRFSAMESYFQREVQRAFDLTNELFQNENKEKSLTTFSIVFDLEPFENDTSIYQDCDFIIKSKKPVFIIKEMH